MDDALKLLEKLVIDEGKCVTKMTVLRQTSLKTRQIESLLDDFYEKNKSLPLSTMFLVLGTKKQDDGVAASRCSVICGYDALEKTKSDFESVISVHVYSLHRASSTSVQTLLNADWSGKYEKPVEPFEQRLGIVCEQAVKALDTICRRRPKITTSSFVILPFMIKVKKGPKPLAKSIVCKSDQHSLKDAFAMAAKNNKAAEELEVDQKPELHRKRPQTASIEPPDELADKKPKIDENSKPKVDEKPVPKKGSIMSFFGRT